MEETRESAHDSFDDQNPHGSKWIHLKEGKEFSRLLYPNPVCFLCTTASFEEQDNLGDQSDIATADADAPVSFSKVDSNHRNVMVISWLTPIDNNGYFVMSVNSRRHSVNHLLMNHLQNDYELKPSSLMTNGRATETNRDVTPAPFFTLCVPTVEMTDIVLQVGGVSGKDHSKLGTSTNRYDEDLSTTNLTMSKRKRRKLQKQRLEAGDGICGLIALPYGSCNKDFRREKGEAGPDDQLIAMEEEALNSAAKATSKDGVIKSAGQELFVIHGTIAHMKCQIQKLLLNHHFDSSAKSCHSSKKDPATVSMGGDATKEEQTNQKHHLFLAKIVDAYVNENYWDSSKLLFCAKAEAVSTSSFCQPGGDGGKSDAVLPKKDDGKNADNNWVVNPSGKHSQSIKVQTVPPYLTFLGSQKFGQIVPLP